MRITVFLVTYNGMAAGPCVQECVEFLMAGAPTDLGEAIEEVEIFARCQTRDPLVDSLSEMYDRFQENLKSLPFLRFFRKLRRFDNSYASEIVHEDAIFHGRNSHLEAADFECLAAELVEALSLMRRRLKKTDDFDIDRLESHLRTRLLSDHPTRSER